MDASALNVEADGAALFPAAFDMAAIDALRAHLDPLLSGRPGRRITGDLRHAIAPMTRIAAGLIGPKAFPVRAVAFDKSPGANWSVLWHQDRTIAVRERIEVDGFGPWSTKNGVQHVAPPMAILEGMATLRLHLDDCHEDNAPLKVALGSHRLGLVPADQVATVAAGCRKMSCHARAGDVWAYATPIVHASDRSRSGGRRRVLQVDYAAVALPGGLAWLGLT